MARKAFRISCSDSALRASKFRDYSRQRSWIALSALAQDIRLQVELRGPHDFHEAAMFAEQADTVLTHVSGQDTRKPWQKGQKGGYMQRPPLQNKSIEEISV